jgi:hypothetical protein
VGTLKIDVANLPVNEIFFLIDEVWKELDQTKNQPGPFLIIHLEGTAV